VNSEAEKRGCDRPSESLTTGCGRTRLLDIAWQNSTLMVPNQMILAMQLFSMRLAQQTIRGKSGRRRLLMAPVNEQD